MIGLGASTHLLLHKRIPFHWAKLANYLLRKFVVPTKEFVVVQATLDSRLAVIQKYDMQRYTIKKTDLVLCNCFTPFLR